MAVRFVVRDSTEPVLLPRHMMEKRGMLVAIFPQQISGALRRKSHLLFGHRL